MGFIFLEAIGKVRKPVKFCSECGTMLKLDPAKKMLVCPKCGYEEPTEDEVLVAKNSNEQDKIVVIGKKEKNIHTMSQTKVKCPKCENMTAYWWMVQTRSIDESATQFFRCTKCSHTWRDYS
jgi:DNA-directed RNA polymerase subunit M